MLRELMSVSEALERLLAQLSPLPSEKVPLLNCLDRVLAQEVVAKDELPPFPNSAMDGFAVRAEDIQAAAHGAPVELEVVGDIPAGSADLMDVGPGEAMRIMTGSAMPPGADCVVPVELTSDAKAMAGREAPARVQILRAVKAGAHVRKAGQDVKRGSKVLARGHRLRPQDIAMLAALGVSQPEVHLTPQVAILSTGDELVEVDRPLMLGQVRDANSYGESSPQLGAPAHCLIDWRSRGIRSTRSHGGLMRPSRQGRT